MPGERASPSGGWREVADAMGVDPDAWFEEDADETKGPDGTDESDAKDEAEEGRGTDEGGETGGTDETDDEDRPRCPECGRSPAAETEDPYCPRHRDRARQPDGHPAD
ncbi:hypothetical protein [Halegenticoccus soli]|uniref:hypothetical protein n=1 Tax=Halegenticoccus soli TaxID=1985678 RepID=UPI000C6CE97F|nr:hypothetical protein [Halegenticoccus soli]